ncbi:MAG: ORF6N domain-containing protein [Opitutaceae bacterium]|nr:ORF6N domain-containing protein [Opitutaceae bacterium]
MPRKTPAAVPAIDLVIHTLRSERVILDADLAKIYGVATKVFNQAVKRNREKFPSDFIFQLSAEEAEAMNRSQIVTGSKGRSLRSQIVTSNKGRGGRRYLPYAFTEHGAIMAANVLNSPQAVHMSVFVVRAFIAMRAVLTDTRELARKLASLEKELTSRLDTHESAIVDVLQRVMALLEPPPPAPETPAKEMGFHTGLKSAGKS